MSTFTDIRKSFMGSVQDASRETVSNMNETVQTLRTQEISLPDVGQQLQRVKPFLPNAWMGILIALLVAAPQVALLLSPMAGVYVTVFSLVALLAFALQNDKARVLAISAAVLPLATMVGLVLPVNSNPFYRVWVEYDVILILAIAYRSMFKRVKLARRYGIKTKQYPYALALMVVIGEVLGVAGYGVLRHQYSYDMVPLPLVAVIALAFACAEELFFRGLIQQHASKLMHPVVSAVLSVVVYVAAAIGLGSLLPLGFAVVTAVTLSTIYYFKRNLVLTTVANAAMKLTYIGLIATFVLK